jgi:hypothetical protein
MVHFFRKVDLRQPHERRCWRVFLLLIFLSCCDSGAKNYNKVFEEKYGKDIEKIKAERSQSKESQKTVTILYPPTEEELRVMNKRSVQNQYNYTAVSRFDEKIPQYYITNRNSYEAAESRNNIGSLPPDMFKIHYRTKLYSEFRHTGAEFDRIAIPAIDAYGVKTEMSEKLYLLTGKKSLQKNIDQINSERTKDDIEISKILIKEQKELRQKQKMQKIFGDEISPELL